MPKTGLSLSKILLSPILLALTLAACGGGGGGGGGSPVPATYSVSGTVSGLTAGTLVLQVAGKPNVTLTTNGGVPLLTGLPNGANYNVSVLTNPTGYSCTVTNGNGTIAAANVTLPIGCTVLPGVTLVLDAPANNALVPIDTAHDITVSFANTSAANLAWTVTPSANATVTAGSSTAGSAVVRFQATVPGSYTVQATSQDDTSKTVTVNLRVHHVYLSIDGYSQARTYLRADGRPLNTTFTDEFDSSATDIPTDALVAVSQGYQFRLGIKTDGTVVAWGEALDSGEQYSPVSPPAGLSNVEQIDTGGDLSIALKDDGTLAVWGKSNYVDTVLPASLVGGKFRAVTAGSGVYAAIRENGSLVVWDASTQALIANPAAAAGKTFTKLCMARWHVVALDSTGAIVVWNAVNIAEPEMDTPPATSAPVTAVFCGSEQAALVQEDGRLMIWGADLDFAVGPFDSNTVSGWPVVKAVSLNAYQATRFLTEGGAVIDTAGELVTSIDQL